jgi:hypothetical protein
MAEEVALEEYFESDLEAAPLDTKSDAKTKYELLLPCRERGVGGGGVGCQGCANRSFGDARTFRGLSFVWFVWSQYTV